MKDSEVERHFVQIAAIGRRFQLGDLYNFKTDSILTECQMASSTQVNAEFKLKLICPDPISNKWEHMGLNKHLQLGVMAGLIESKFEGASNYSCIHNSPQQATTTLICCTQSRNELLDLPSLRHKASTILADWKQWDATHVVVRIVYGAEAYCVFTQDINSSDVENAKKHSEENLSRITLKMEDALEDGQHLIEFKKQFDRKNKRLLSRLNCHLYSDLQRQAVRECDIFDCYKHCLKLIEGIKNPEMESNIAVPIAAILCPLKVLTSSNEIIGVKLDYRDVDESLVIQCRRIWTELEQVCAEVDTIRNKAPKSERLIFSQFKNVIVEFLKFLTNSLKEAVVEAREVNGDDEDIEIAVSIVEGHPLFGPNQLNRWLNYKKAELEMVAKMSTLKRIEFVGSKIQLEQVLVESFDTKFALVLSIPPLDEWTNETVEEMTEFAEDFSRLWIIDDDDFKEENGLPWHLVPHQRKEVLVKIRELANHVERNQHLGKQVQFFIVPEECGEEFRCRYSVYEGHNLLQDNLKGLPSPSTGLRINSVKSEKSLEHQSFIHVEWDYEDFGYPSCHFAVQFRMKDGYCNRAMD